MDGVVSVAVHPNGIEAVGQESWAPYPHPVPPLLFLERGDRVRATASLSLADAWIAALALLNQGELVHKDPEFEQLSARLNMLRLPYK
jgi:hypothetical protein